MPRARAEVEPAAGMGSCNPPALVRQSYDGCMRSNRAPAYWPARVVLVAGFLATAAVVLWARHPADSPCFGCDYPQVFGMPSPLVLGAVSVGLAVVGLLRMVRIFRGPRDEPPAWRYRR